MLVGLMGAGKSSVGALLAQKLALPLIDLDTAIVQRAGKTIPEIFAAHGEAAFRSLETKALSDVCNGGGDGVLATGGGAIVAAENRTLMKQAGVVVWLDGAPEVLAARIDGDANRPLLAGASGAERLRALAAQRNPLYAEIADVRVDTVALSPKQAVEYILEALGMRKMTDQIRCYTVDLGERSYDIHIEAGSLSRLGAAMRALFPKASRCMVVSNDVVAPLYLEQTTATLEASGWHVGLCILPDGEQHKNMVSWSMLMDALMASKLSRSEPVIALGGGVIGDMTGFAASCYRRGIPFVQVPTTLLAQVDSSVGGKTAINHPHGKNMIGAFYQPRLVWIDPNVLQTLDVRQLRAGIAELIKYGLIRDAEFFHDLNIRMQDVLSLDADVVAAVIYHSCRHKAEVVMADETEQGQRALLNLGHTFGHAIESMTHYQRYLHGEAVALGTLLAARLSCQLGYAKPSLEMDIQALYELAGLDVVIPQFSADDWLDAMGHDKKNIGAQIRYVLLRDVGDAFIADDVSHDDIRTLIASFAA